jgi:hypothetical protein
MYAKHLISNIKLLIFLFSLSLPLFACTAIKTGLSDASPPEGDPLKIAKVRMILAMLESRNESLQNFKGIGNIKVFKDGKIRINQRVAWIGAKPAKISIAVLVSGYPAVRIASDGKWVYYLEAQGDQHVYKKFPSSNDSLKRLISIPIPPHDVISLLAGRVPIREHHSASMPEDDNGQDTIVVLRKRWWGIVEKIYYQETKSCLRKVEIFDRSGSLVYRANLQRIRDIQGFRIPFRIEISDGKGAYFELDIEKYWANVTTTPSMFVVKPPNE